MFEGAENIALRRGEAAMHSVGIQCQILTAPDVRCPHPPSFSERPSKSDRGGDRDPASQGMRRARSLILFRSDPSFALQRTELRLAFMAVIKNALLSLPFEEGEKVNARY